MKCRPAPGGHRQLCLLDSTTWFGYSHQRRKGWAASPVARCWRRGLGAGVPAGTHGTTFGGNPLAATVANSVLAQIDSALLAGVGERRHIVDKLNALNAKYDVFGAVRGMGLLIGAELASHLRGKAKALTNLAAEEG